MKKILGIKIPDKKDKEVLTEEDFINAAGECGYPKMIGQKLYKTMLDYAGDKKLTRMLIRSIPDEEIETIKGIKSAGHAILVTLLIMK